MEKRECDVFFSRVCAHFGCVVLWRVRNPFFSFPTRLRRVVLAVTLCPTPHPQVWHR